MLLEDSPLSSGQTEERRFREELRRAKQQVSSRARADGFGVELGHGPPWPIKYQRHATD